MRTSQLYSFAAACLRQALLAMFNGTLCSMCLLAQTSPTKPASSDASLPGFSIETEMLTYRALESNSEAVACDISAFLYGTSANFKNPPAGSVCNVVVSGQPASGVIVLPFDQNAFANFQAWQADMQTMARMEQGASCAVQSTLPPTPAPAPSGSDIKRGSVGGPLLDATPIGAAISTASGVLGLFAADRSTSAVSGTIQDQAFMDGVSRELRGVNISVLMPTAYGPYVLTSIDPTRSPFLTALAKLQKTRDCLAKDNPRVKDIDAFFATLSGTSVATAVAAAPPTTSNTGQNPGSSSPQQSGIGTSPSKTNVATPSHFEAVLAADGLAQRLGADPVTGRIPDNAPQHVLLLKALESGGSVLHSTNILGTKYSYSGGSVGSYALFNLNGELECSGNVYDYAGSIPSKDFRKQLRAYTPDPSTQVIFQTGSCHR